MEAISYNILHPGHGLVPPGCEEMSSVLLLAYRSYVAAAKRALLPVHPPGAAMKTLLDAFRATLEDVF